MSEWEAEFERSERGGRSVLVVTGEVDLSVAAKFERALEQVVRDAPAGRAFVDLSGVAFMDSSGVRELLKARQAARVTGGDLLLVNPSAACRRVLEVSGILSDFSVS